MTHGRKIDVAATFAILGSITCWTVGPVFIKYLSSYIDFWTQNFLRYCAACLFWLPFLFFSIKTKKLDKRVWKKAFLLALANMGVQSFWAASLYYMYPGFSSLLAKSSLIWIIVLSLILFAQERVLLKSKRFWAGMLLSIAGVIGVLVNKEGFTSGDSLIGIVLCLIYSFLWAAYTITVKLAFRDIDVRSGFSVISIYTVIGLGILVFIFGQPSQSLQMQPRPWFCVIISGIFSIAISHVLYYFSIKRIGAMIPSLALLASPFTVFTVSYLVFGETMSVLQWLFGVVLLLGCALSIWSQDHIVGQAAS